MTPRDRRAALLGGLTIMVALLVLKVIPWSVRRWRLASERLEQNRVLLTETRQALASLPSMEDSMRTLTQAVARLAPRLLSGSSSDAAFSDLTARVTSLAGWHHAAMVTLNQTPDSTVAGSLRRVSATVVLQGDFRGVAGIVRTLARDSVAMVIERIRVTATEPVAPVSSPEKLQVELQLSSWYLAQGGG